MSRSYKKTPGWTQSSGCSYSRFMKRYANKRFRKYKEEVQNGKWYRKHTDSWDICDYKFLYWSKNEVLREIDGRINPSPHDYWRSSWHQPLYRYYMK